MAQLGSNWNNGTNDSGFYWNVNNTPSNRNRNIGRQLANARLIQGLFSKKMALFHIKISLEPVYPASWQNIKTIREAVLVILAPGKW